MHTWTVSVAGRALARRKLLLVPESCCTWVRIILLPTCQPKRCLRCRTWGLGKNRRRASLRLRPEGGCVATADNRASW